MFWAELLRSDSNQANGEKEGKVRLYESGMRSITNVYDVRLLTSNGKNTHREKETEAHVKLDIKRQDTNRMMGMTM